MARLVIAAATSRNGRRGESLRDAVLVAACVLAGLFPSSGTAAPNVQITGLSDVSFGILANLNADLNSAQSVCVFSNTKTNGYNVMASGTGTGGAFTLASGSRALAYEVQWSGSAGQTSGVQLSPNAALTGLTSTATQQTCNKGPATTASFIVLVRSANLSTATAGTYTGTLTLTISPE